MANVRSMTGALGGNFYLPEYHLNKKCWEELLMACKDAPVRCNSLTEVRSKRSTFGIDFDMKRTDGYVELTEGNPSPISVIQQTMGTCFPSSSGHLQCVILTSSGQVNGLFKTSYTLNWPMIVHEVSVHKAIATEVSKSLASKFGKEYGDAVDLQIYKANGGGNCRLLFNDKFDRKYCDRCLRARQKGCRQCELAPQGRVRMPFAIVDDNGKIRADGKSLTPSQVIPLTLIRRPDDATLSEPSAHLQIGITAGAETESDHGGVGVATDDPIWRLIQQIPVPGHCEPPTIDRIQRFGSRYVVRVAKHQPCFFKAKRNWLLMNNGCIAAGCESQAVHASNQQSYKIDMRQGKTILSCKGCFDEECRNSAMQDQMAAIPPDMLDNLKKLSDIDELREDDWLGNDRELARVFCKRDDGCTVITDCEKGTGYIWNEGSCLWVESSPSQIQELIKRWTILHTS
jgi:hypothetical protein